MDSSAALLEKPSFFMDILLSIACRLRACWPRISARYMTRLDSCHSVSLSHAGSRLNRLLVVKRRKIPRRLSESRTRRRRKSQAGMNCEPPKRDTQRTLLPTGVDQNLHIRTDKPASGPSRTAGQARLLTREERTGPPPPNPFP